MALTQPTILWIIVACDVVAILVFSLSLYFPWYHTNSSMQKLDGEPDDLTLFEAMNWKANGMYILASVAAVIGGMVAALISIGIHFLGDRCISIIGMDWFAGFIKGLMMRACSMAIMSCALIGFFSGFQCRDKGDSMGLGWYMNLIVGPFGLVATVLIYYLPFAPSGSKGMFASDSDDSDYSDDDGDDDDDGDSYGSLDDDDDDDDDDEESGKKNKKKKKKGDGGWGGWGLGGGAGSDESGESETQPINKKKGRKK